MPKKTQTELLTEHRAELDAEYLERWPQGQFVVQRYNSHLGLYWNPRRNTSHTRYKGIGIENRQRYGAEEGAFPVNHQNCCFGKCTYYATFDKLVAGAIRLGIPEEMIAAFTERYQNRASEGFTI